MAQARTARTNPGASHGMMSSAFHLALRPKKTAPGTELCNPADFVDELVFFARVLPFVPHHAMFRFPVRVDARRKPENEKGGYISSCCGHKYHLLALQLPKLTLLRPAFLVLRCIPTSIPGSLGRARHCNRCRRNPLCGKTVSDYRKNCGTSAFAEPERP